ncbi:biotin--acetyl-CoA-carboxylase ligase [Swaminathania salitolerans LMG 21291]|uniref:biotin--[biotin carboxyl-carrier protein] ligase n=2 Tax=Swaminathania salitolerans TaxID=182838 RepID=A0A511BPC3_9PROT|nr:biotin--acetyl-CoA-carboxylase ligase [Swaminathania salitolerans LMG 21291]GEL02167.1 biotin--[acetyl-CoA-carboxylase] ligase [Swaminathania salitolerans]
MPAGPAAISKIATRMAFIWSLTCHETLGSTSDLCKSEAEKGAADGTAVLAYRQTSGRGTRGRLWQAPEGNLSFSFICRDRDSDSLIAVLPFLVAVAIHDALAPVVPDAVLQLKWPNDLVCEGAKLCGVLIERGGAGRSGWIVVGIGANLRTAPEIPGRRTICLEALGRSIAPREAAERILAAFSARLSLWEREGFEPLRAAWLERAHPLGTRLAVQRGDNYIEGFFAGLDASGRLLLQTDQGDLQAFLSGDILLLG